MQLTECRLQLIHRRFDRALGRSQVCILRPQFKVHGRTLCIQILKCFVDLLQLRIRLIDLRHQLIQRGRIDPQRFQLTFDLRSHDRIILVFLVLFMQRLDGRSILLQRNQLITTFLQLHLRCSKLLCSLRLPVLHRFFPFLYLLLSLLCSCHAALHLTFRIAHLTVDSRSNF